MNEGIGVCTAYGVQAFRLKSGAIWPQPLFRRKDQRVRRDLLDVRSRERQIEVDAVGEFIASIAVVRTSRLA